jgi:hypothetical protein
MGTFSFSSRCLYGGVCAEMGNLPIVACSATVPFGQLLTKLAAVTLACDPLG